MEAEPILLLTVEQTAKALGVGVRTLYTLDGAGKIPAPVRVGGRKRWDAEELRAWIRAECPTRRKWEQAYRP